MCTSSIKSGRRPPTREAGSDSQEWDMEAYAEAVSGGKQTWKPLRETPWPAKEQEATEAARQVQKEIKRPTEFLNGTCSEVR